MKPLLSVQNLRVHFSTPAGEVQAVRGVSFDLAAKEILAIVGESGCGKSVTAQSVLKLVPEPPGRYPGGKILFAGQDLLAKGEKEMEQLRGRQIGMVFQNPMTSLNPTMQVGRQIEEVLRRHSSLPAAQTKKRAVEMLALVGLPDPAGRYAQYPHQFSGGMRQRIAIAMALACKPKLLLADEPTSALDVTVQAQILELMSELKEQLGAAIILITHDLAVVAGFATRVLVMYAGEVVEDGPAGEVLSSPAHPYTRALLASRPGLDRRPGGRLTPVPGSPPDLIEPPPGCAFWPRCSQAMVICRRLPPPENYPSRQHRVHCWLTHPWAAERIGAVVKISYTNLKKPESLPPGQPAN